ncbi:MAG: VanW family protein [Rikenellaceae bacterium]
MKKNFCEISPLTYFLSRKKEIYKRKLKNFVQKDRFVNTFFTEKLSNIISSHSSTLLKVGKGVDPTTQYNKVNNINLAVQQINGLEIKPGEVFSFWQRVGNPSQRRGFKTGRVIIKGNLTTGVGGGLCNLANTINLLVLNSPLTITELHKHSDALFPDNGRRIPFGAGTSVSYNYIDYRFRNDTNQVFQIFVRSEGNVLYGELRSEQEFPFNFRLIEEEHYFKKVNNKYYRFSKVYREKLDRCTRELLSRELVWDNKSLVMFDYKFIPDELIR